MDLKEELKRRGLKQVRVAWNLDIPTSRFAGFCNGWMRPTAEQAERIADFLGVDADELFPPRERPDLEMRGGSR